MNNNIDDKKKCLYEKMASPQGTTIGELRIIGGFETTEELLEFLANEVGINLPELSGQRIEDIKDDQLICIENITPNDCAKLTKIMTMLSEPEGISLKEIKELTGWNDENLAENMNTCFGCNLAMLLQKAVTDEFRIRCPQD